jgi:hypothetical protein
MPKSVRTYRTVALDNIRASLVKGDKVDDVGTIFKGNPNNI